MSRLFPTPILSALLWLNWVLVQGSFDAGTFVAGAILATALPLVARRFWPDAPQVRHPLKVARYVAVFLYDVLVANLQVALWILGPQSKLQPRFVHIPVELEHPFAQTVFASTISLTPGTVSSHFSGDRKLLIVHCLNAPDEAEVIAAIKERYEAPLREILE